MTDPEFIVSFLNSGCSKFFYTSSLELGFSDSQNSVGYLELVQSLDRTALAYLCASYLGVQAISRLVLWR